MRCNFTSTRGCFKSTRGSFFAKRFLSRSFGTSAEVELLAEYLDLYSKLRRLHIVLSLAGEWYHNLPRYLVAELTFIAAAFNSLRTPAATVSRLTQYWSTEYSVFGS